MIKKSKIGGPTVNGGAGPSRKRRFRLASDVLQRGYAAAAFGDGRRAKKNEKLGSANFVDFTTHCLTPDLEAFHHTELNDFYTNCALHNKHQPQQKTKVSL